MLIQYVVKSCLKGLNHLEEHSICVREVNASNIVVTESGHVKVSETRLNAPVAEYL